MVKVVIPEGMKAPEQTKIGVVGESALDRVDKKIQKAGKYEITKENYFRIEFGLDEVGEGDELRWIIIDKDEKNKEIDNHWVEFRMWSFEEETNLRKLSTSYDQLKRTHFVDNDQLNRLKVQQLLKAWSFGEENERLKLLHVNGVLVDESYKSFINLYPTIIRYILDRMNNVLEYNG